jgi:serine/threonine protein kinase
MEYLPMGELYFYLRRKEIPFPEALIRGVVAEIIVGMGVLHKFGVVYRELKPENILVTDKGHIKLTDYGLSKVIIEDKQSVSTFVGSLEYMPPEAIEGNGEFGQKGDLWALGVLMFELHFRESPFGFEWREGMPL